MMTRAGFMMMKRIRMCGVQNVEQVVGEKFTWDVFEEGEREEGDNSGKVNLEQQCCQHLEGLIS